MEACFATKSIVFTQDNLEGTLQGKIRLVDWQSGVWSKSLEKQVVFTIKIKDTSSTTDFSLNILQMNCLWVRTIDFVAKNASTILILSCTVYRVPRSILMLLDENLELHLWLTWNWKKNINYCGNDRLFVFNGNILLAQFGCIE